MLFEGVEKIVGLSRIALETSCNLIGNIILMGKVMKKILYIGACLSLLLVVIPKAEAQTAYCDSRSNNYQYMFINRVRILVNSSREVLRDSVSQGSHYLDRTGSTNELVPGETYSLEVSPGYQYNTYRANFKAWLDFNQNGNFENSELVFQGAGTQTVAANFTVPDDATAGTTRLRIAMDYYSISSPCGNKGYGEVEDYGIEITATADDRGGDDSSSLSRFLCRQSMALTSAPSDALELITPTPLAVPKPCSIAVTYNYTNGVGGFTQRLYSCTPSINTENEEYAECTVEYPTPPEKCENGRCGAAVANTDGRVASILTEDMKDLGCTNVPNFPSYEAGDEGITVSHKVVCPSYWIQ